MISIITSEFHGPVEIISGANNPTDLIHCCACQKEAQPLYFPALYIDKKSQLENINIVLRCSDCFIEEFGLDSFFKANKVYIK